MKSMDATILVTQEDKSVTKKKMFLRTFGWPLEPLARDDFWILKEIV